MSMRRRIVSKPALAVLVVAAMTLAAWRVGAAAAEGLEALRQRRHDTHLQWVAARARVLREDPEAAALRERIEGLYRDLDRLVSSRPAVARLEAELKRLDGALQAQAAATGKASPVERTTP